jgi:hypothetical protein
MKYLLIDFGASFVKNAVYDDLHNTISDYTEIESPFLITDKLPLSEIKSILDFILQSYSECDYVITSSIKNGTYNKDIYESWKIKLAGNNSCDLFSKFFENQNTYHIHNDHNKQSNIFTIKKLGVYKEKIFLSCLGDTDCVLRSKNLTISQCIVNMGTGSQIISTEEIISFIPSGRMFNIFRNFFNQLNFEIFDYFKKLNVYDLDSSDLKFDLSVFPQAKNFIDYGKILNINETNFNLHNFVSSLMKNYLDQYIEYIAKKDLLTIFLTGGIAQKVPVIKEYFEYKFPEKKIILDKNCNVHLGMVEMIKNEKNSDNWL